MKKFEPMKAYNKKEDLSTISYPKLVSFKLDGIRCIYKDGEAITRSLKSIVNKQIKEKLKSLEVYSKENNVILDGEIYAHGITFSLISSCVMTIDYTTKNSIKAWKELQEKHNTNITREEVFSRLKYYAFDCVNQEKFDEPFVDRIDTLQDMSNTDEFNDIFIEVGQDKIESYKDVEVYFAYALEEGYEGLMLKGFDTAYKCGRSTYKEDTMHKLKPYVTFDAVILGVLQATEVDPSAEVTKNELGRSVTSKKQEDRVYIEQASGFQVEYEGNFCFPTLTMTAKEKKEVWANQEDYIGKMIEYKGLLYGSMIVPRHPVMTRFREDKEDE